jgi:hypothetical protein
MMEDLTICGRRYINTTYKGTSSMANSFIHYKVTNGVEYASIFTPRRDNGKKVNDPEYLGCVGDWIRS